MPGGLEKGAQFIALGGEFAGSVVAGVIAGYYLDGYLGSAPWLTLILTLGGLAGGLYRLVWALSRANSQESNGN